jgi:hypothetical protein
VTRGFVIDGPFMVFGDGMITASRLLSLVLDEACVWALVDGAVDPQEFKRMSPEQERDYKPMFPANEPIAYYPVANPPEPTAKWSNPDTCPGRHIYPIGSECKACGRFHPGI